MLVRNKPTLVYTHKSEMDSNDPVTAYLATANTGGWFKNKLLGMMLKRKLKKMPQKDLSFFQSFPLGIFYDFGNACRRKSEEIMAQDPKSNAFDLLAMIFLIREFALDSETLPKITLKDFVYTEKDLQNTFYAIFAYDSEYIANLDESATPPPSPGVQKEVKLVYRKRRKLLKELYPMVNKIRQNRTEKMDKITKELFSNESNTVDNE